MDPTPEFSKPLSVPGSHAQLRLQETLAWRDAKASFFTSGDTPAALAAVSTTVERAVVGAYLAAMGANPEPAAALLALGAFGRSELFPSSEVEVLVLFGSDAPSPALKESLSEFARLLWELGLRLNHSARPLTEALDVRDQNLDFTLALLNQREHRAQLA